MVIDSIERHLATGWQIAIEQEVLLGLTAWVPCKSFAY